MKYKCMVCGHIYDEEKAGVKFADLPDDWKCPICKQPKSKFEPVNETAELTWASEHKIGIASDLDEEMKDFLRAEFAGECSEVGMYLAMSRAAIRQGYSTKENLEARVAAENGACAGKTAFAKKCKEMGLDALHDSIHEMARDEARHGQGFKGLLDRYFK